MRKRRTVVKFTSTVAIAILLAGFACSNWERQTYQSLAASKAVVDQAQADYESGALPKTAVSFAAINEAKAGQVAAVQSLAAYEGIKANKGSTTALTSSQATVNATLAALPNLIAAVKALYLQTKAVTK
jgi:hypothetical protein